MESIEVASEAVPKSEMFLSRRRLGWAGLSALAGCAALCALPLLVAASVGSGAATAIARFVRPGSEIVVGGVLFVVALGVMALYFRSKTRARAEGGCAGSCALPSLRPAGPPSISDAGSDTRAGAGPKPRAARIFSRQRVADAPIVCTADLTLARVQIDGYRAAFARLVGAERFPGGFRWKFRTEPGLESQLTGLAEREAACCRFFSYDLTSDGAYIIWETGSDDRASSVLDMYFQLPQRLLEEARPGLDVAALKRAAGDAGLAFAADARIVGSTMK